MPRKDGPQNYEAAQSLLDEAEQAELGSDKETYLLKAAHVHAMLAVAASNIDAAQRDNVVAWNEAMGVHPKVERCINGKPWHLHTNRCGAQCNWVSEP